MTEEAGTELPASKRDGWREEGLGERERERERERKREREREREFELENFFLQGL